MDRDKRRERRRDRWGAPQRVRFASSLGVNCFKLGAGVSFCVMACGLMDGFAAAADGQNCVDPGVDRPASEIRLKSIGAAISLTPIGQAADATPIAKISRPHPSKIQLDPMIGDANEVLDLPVFVGVDTEVNVATAVDEDASLGTDTSVSDTLRPCQKPEFCDSDSDEPLCESPGHANHPRILSMRLLDQDASTDHRNLKITSDESTADDSSLPLAKVTKSLVELPSSILETSSVLEPPSVPGPSPQSDVGWEVNGAISFSFSDASSDLAADAEENANLPLLPVPNRQWVAADSMASLSDRNTDTNAGQRRRPAEVAAPPTNSARVERLSSHHPRSTVPAKLAGYVRPSRSAPRHQSGVTGPMDSTSLMMTEIQKHYPEAQVVLARSDNRLVVRGNCHDRKQATAIIRLIRSRHLIPVDDQLVIR